MCDDHPGVEISKVTVAEAVQPCAHKMVQLGTLQDCFRQRGVKRAIQVRKYGDAPNRAVVFVEYRPQVSKSRFCPAQRRSFNGDDARIFTHKKLVIAHRAFYSSDPIVLVDDEHSERGDSKTIYPGHWIERARCVLQHHSAAYSEF